MAALTFVAASTNYSTTLDEYTLRLPAGYAVGDILILGIAIRGSSMPVLDPFWKPLLSSNSGNGSTSTSDSLAGHAVYWAQYTGGTIPLTATRDRASNTATDVHTHNVIALRGGTDASPIGDMEAVVKTLADATSLFTTIPGLTTETADETILVMGFGSRNGTYRVPVLDVVDPDPAAFSQISHASSSTGSDTLLAMWMANKAAPGPTGNITIEHSATARHNAAAIAIRSVPKAVAPPEGAGRRQRMVLVS